MKCMYCNNVTTAGCYICNPMAHSDSTVLPSQCHITELEAENARLKGFINEGELATIRYAEAAEAKLEQVRELPKRWLKLAEQNVPSDFMQCADELDAVLGD